MPESENSYDMTFLSLVMILATSVIIVLDNSALNFESYA